MPSPQIHLLGNEASAPELIVRWCKQRWQTHLPPGIVFCVPTSLAMRRLRDALTEAYHAFHGVRFTLPAGLFSYFTPSGAENIATETELLCAWDKVFDWLQAADAEHLVATYLFPNAKKWLERAATRYTVAQRLIHLRATLVEAMLDFGGVAQHPATAQLDERERGRWAALDLLESKFREVLSAAGLSDPVDRQLDILRHPIAQPIESQSHWQLIVACVPDLMPALSRLFDAAPACDVLIQTDKTDVACFTTFGTPSPEFWNHTHLFLPDNALELAETPTDEALCAERFLAADGTINPSEICLCVLNHEVMPPLTDRFESHQIRMFEPDPICLNSQPAIRALQQLFRLCQQDDIEHITPLMSLPEIAVFLRTDYATLRTDYMELLEQHQPGTLKEARHFTAQTSPLRHFLTQLHSWMLAIQRSPCDGARAFLVDLFGTIFADPVKDALLFATFEAIQSLLNEIETARIPGATPSIALLNARINQTTLHPVRGGNDCSYEGRFELLWSPAARFVLAGLNEGIFPDTTFEDAFLPNHFRATLGLRSDNTRLARDAYLLETLSRRCPPQNLKLLCSRLNARGDWLKPSRLFFRCRPEQQLHRARKFFLTPSARNAPTGADSGIMLREAPHQWRAHWQLPKRLSASFIRLFLHSPVEFLFQKILHLEDTNRNIDGVPANTFGTMLHDAMEVLHQTDSHEVPILKALLQETFLQRFAERYGSTSNVELIAVRHAALKRLALAAECEVAIRNEGWKTHYIEAETKNKDWEVTLTIRGNPLTLYGQIDRIDYHAERNIWRIIDYKTGRHAISACDDHYKQNSRTGEVTWSNFQLPLYRLLARHALRLPQTSTIELAYFTLPAEGKPAIVPFYDPVSEQQTLQDLEDVLEKLLDFADPETLYQSAESLQTPLIRHLLTHLKQ